MINILRSAYAPISLVDLIILNLQWQLGFCEESSINRRRENRLINKNVNLKLRFRRSGSTSKGSLSLLKLKKPFLIVVLSVQYSCDYITWSPQFRLPSLCSWTPDLLTFVPKGSLMERIVQDSLRISSKFLVKKRYILLERSNK